MRYIKAIIPLFLLAYCQNSSEHINKIDVTSEELIQHINYLTSPKLSGRKTGEIGGELASEYISQEFNRYGLHSIGQSKNFIQTYPILHKVTIGENCYISFMEQRKIGIKSVKSNSSQSFNTFDLKPEVDFKPLSFSSKGSVEGELVLAGYGISAPKQKYDDYKDLNVKDKIAIIMTGTPNLGNSSNSLISHTPLRYKAFIAREKGAKAVLFVNQHKGNLENDFPESRESMSFQPAGLPVFFVRGKKLKEFINKKGYSLFHKDKNQNNVAHSIILKGLTSSLNADLIYEKKIVNNVIGYIEGQSPDKKDELIIIGAHYDHLGLGYGGVSLDQKAGKIHHGADDNASGVAGLLELAQYFSKNRLSRSILFISFSGEEQGLLGSSYYVKNPLYPLSKTALMVNLDMIGRQKENKLIIHGVGSAEGLRKLVTSANTSFSKPFRLVLSESGFGPSDHTPFYVAKVPVLFFFTGVHGDYHRSSDLPEKINSSGQKRIIDFIIAFLKRIDTKPKLKYVKGKENRPAHGGRARFRVSLGTIPDYSVQVEGVKLSGVKEGTPAAKARLKAGDIIIEFGKRKIKNIYDYVYSLQEHKPGDVVIIKVLRNGKVKQFEVTLEKR